MNKNDLSAWLKASAENKITTKNTWKSTLIECFSDISQFRNNTGVNFQKAGCALEGCVKVYSTRVDDVSDHTNKLLELYKKEDETKIKKTRKNDDYIEKKISNIDIREGFEEEFYDPVFRNILKNDSGRFMVDIVDERKEGMCLYETIEDDIIYEDEKVEIECEILPVCSVLKNIRGENDNYIESTIKSDNQNSDKENFNFEKEEMENELNDFEKEEMENELNDFEKEEIRNEMNDSNNICNDINIITSDNIIACESAFGYFKGWAGPLNWKTDLGKKNIVNRTKRKEKEEYFINFSEEIDISEIFEKTDKAIMSKENILERRKNKNLLPEDYRVEIKDLYRFFIKDGYFKVIKNKLNENNNLEINENNNLEINENNNLEINENNNLEINENNNLEIKDSIINNMNYEEHINNLEINNDISIKDNHFIEKLENSLILHDIEFPIRPSNAAKQVDIKKLKNMIFYMYKENIRKLSEIYKSIKMRYDIREAKDISPQICLITMLHLANENDIKMEKKGDDILLY